MTKNLLDFSVAVFMLGAILAAVGAFAIGHELRWPPLVSGLVAVVGVAQVVWLAVVSAALSQLLARQDRGLQGAPTASRPEPK